ncbi:ferredoxin [Microtetraspora sp. NBRC 13810]|uniref:ferredoxin n=1 Tax=Microtetraspora sp. NBRC 13810 TaxID=3030990 RepID=UPI0024A0CE59|nr:ferredoxin [Microtetraspora sp. NBRC 13810]GLW11249.1 ferredoxin [Microtetraspora sp. NBRC 13810]
MRIDIDEPACIGSGQCVLIAPEVFGQRDEDGTVVLLRPEPGAESREAVHEAAGVCPARAIMVGG